MDAIIEFVFQFPSNGIVVPNGFFNGNIGGVLIIVSIPFKRDSSSEHYEGRKAELEACSFQFPSNGIVVPNIDESEAQERLKLTFQFPSNGIVVPN